MTRIADKAGQRHLLYTVGHSTHPIEEFLALLRTHRIELLADVRSFPSSRRWPQFNQAELEKALAANRIEYRWIRALGGRRHSRRAQSPHTAWEHPAFRSYADYADGPEFRDGLAELMRLGSESRTAMMCSEGLWWRCHRRIISDYLTARGWTVLHIMPDGRTAEHELAEFASRHDGRLVYDGGQHRLDLK